MEQMLYILIVALALAGPPLIAVYGTRTSARPAALSTNLLCQAMLLGLVALVLVLFNFGGRYSLSSIGFQAPDLGTLLWAAGMAAFFILALGPVLMRLPHWLGLSGFEATLSDLSRLPVWYLIIAVLIGGAAEEILYRGVALAILTSLLGDAYVAAAVIVLAFGLAHLPLWGPGPALTTVISGAALTVFFLWHGDLFANIIAHVVTDFVGIVLGPLREALRRRE